MTILLSVIFGILLSAVFLLLVRTNVLKRISIDQVTSLLKRLVRRYPGYWFTILFIAGVVFLYGILEPSDNLRDEFVGSVDELPDSSRIDVFKQISHEISPKLTRGFGLYSLSAEPAGLSVLKERNHPRWRIGGSENLAIVASKRNLILLDDGPQMKQVSLERWGVESLNTRSLRQDGLNVVADGIDSSGRNVLIAFDGIGTSVYKKPEFPEKYPCEWGCEEDLIDVQKEKWYFWTWLENRMYFMDLVPLYSEEKPKLDSASLPPGIEGYFSTYFSRIVFTEDSRKSSRIFVLTSDNKLKLLKKPKPNTDYEIIPTAHRENVFLVNRTEETTEIFQSTLGRFGDQGEWKKTVIVGLVDEIGFVHVVQNGDRVIIGGDEKIWLWYAGKKDSLVFDKSKLPAFSEHSELCLTNDGVYVLDSEFDEASRFGDFRYNGISLVSKNGMNEIEMDLTGYSRVALPTFSDRLYLLATIGENSGHVIGRLTAGGGQTLEATVLDLHWDALEFVVRIEPNPSAILAVIVFLISVYILGLAISRDLFQQVRIDEKGFLDQLKTLKYKIHSVETQMKRLRIRSDGMLFLGITIGIFGLLAFLLYVEIVGLGAPDQDESTANWINLARPVALLLFVETLAVFFLKQYQAMYREYKSFYSLYLKLHDFFHCMEVANDKTLSDKEKVTIANRIYDLKYDLSTGLEPGLKEPLWSKLAEVAKLRKP